MTKSFYAALFFVCLYTSCFSQTTGNGASDDIDFAFYLFEERKYDETILFFEQNILNFKQNTSAFDSISYILGMTHYYRKELEKSAFHLSNVSKSSAFYDKSIFFSALDYAHLGEYSKAQTILENYSTATPNSNYDELLAVNLAGIGLLKRDFDMFDRHAKNFRFEQYYYANSQSQLINARKELYDFRKKSPFAAGTFSAIVPGAGKIYTGQIGEGVAAFLTVGVLAAITAENWTKNGIADWKTITFGSVFTIFYIGNIVGSAATVKIYRNQFNDRQNNTILLDIHLPVRALFE